MTRLLALFILAFLSCSAVAQNTRTQSITPLKGANNFLYHRLLPDENSTYVMNVPAVNEVDIPYANLDPTSIGTVLYIKKMLVKILGPRSGTLGGFLLVLEKNGVVENWLPLVVVDDEQGVGEVTLPDGYEIPMTNDLQFCFSTQYLPYSSGSSWTFGAGWIKRTVEVYVWYHVGP